MRKIVFDFNDIDKSKLISENQNTNKKSKPSTKGMYEYIAEVMKSQNGKMGLGIHAVRKEKSREKSIDEILKEICNNGLDINKGSSVLATVSSLGVSSELKDYQKETLKNYKLGNEMAENGVIVLVPTILEGNGEKLYVGFPGMDTSTVGNNHKTTCILDQLCCGDNDHGKFPKEFILGSFKEENGERIFQKNMSYFSEIGDEEKGIFIKKLSNRLTEQQRQISEAVINQDMQRLEQLSIEIYGNRDGTLGEDTIIQNAMFYLNRDIDQVEQSGNNIKSDTKKSKRRILLNSYQDVKLSDLTDAKEILKEGIEKQERDYEGKEI